jgi:hypothetical protein
VISAIGRGPSDLLASLTSHSDLLTVAAARPSSRFFATNSLATMSKVKAPLVARHGWTGEDRQLPLFADESIRKVPKLSAGRRHPKLEAAAVREFRDTPFGRAPGTYLLISERPCWPGNRALA